MSTSAPPASGPDERLPELPVAGPAAPAGLTAGERYHERWVDGTFAGPPGDGPHLWLTLGYRRVLWEPGRAGIAWDAGAEYCFPTAGGPVVQGGLVTAALDAAMGGATWTTLNLDQAFLTADLRVEFLRSATVGTLTALGAVVRRTRRVIFAQAELYDAQWVLLATSRCTQVVLSADGRSGRYDS